MTTKKHKFVGGTIQPFGDLKIRVKRQMDLHMYWAAQEFRDKALVARDDSEKARKEGDSGRDAEAISREFRYGMLSTLLAALALEAHINRFAIEKFGWEWFKEYDDPGPEQRRPSLEDKWFDIPNRATGQSFERGKEPFQSLSKVVELRNYIVHNKPKFHEPVPWRGTTVPEPTARLNLDSAELACRTFEEMTRELETFVKASESDRTT